MQKFRFFCAAALSSFLIIAFADPSPALKSVSFKIDNKTKHSVDLDMDGGVNGDCKKEKDLITCNTDKEGKISIGGHLALDRNFKKPSGDFGPILSVTNPSDDGINFKITPVDSSPVQAKLSSEKWAKSHEEMTITVVAR